MTYGELIAFINQNLPDNNNKFIKAKNTRDVARELAKYSEDEIEKIRGLATAGISGHISTSTSSPSLNSLSNGFYIAQDSGSYNNELSVTEGHFVIMEKDSSGWSIAMDMEIYVEQPLFERGGIRSVDGKNNNILERARSKYIECRGQKTIMFNVHQITDVNLGVVLFDMDKEFIGWFHKNIDYINDYTFKTKQLLINHTGYIRLFFTNENPELSVDPIDISENIKIIDGDIIENIEFNPEDFKKDLSWKAAEGLGEGELPGRYQVSTASDSIPYLIRVKNFSLTASDDLALSFNLYDENMKFVTGYSPGEYVANWVKMKWNGYIGINKRNDTHPEFVRIIQNEISTNELTGKKVSIIGDSISAGEYLNYQYQIRDSDIGNSMQFYPTPYDVDKGLKIGSKTISRSDVGSLTTVTPVSADVDKKIGQSRVHYSGNPQKIWWDFLSKSLDFDLLKVIAYSGSSITSHEDDVEAQESTYAWHDSVVDSLKGRDSNNNDVNPECVIIYRGINDFSKQPYSKITDWDFSDYDDLDNDFDGSDYDFKKGYALTVKKIKEKYPDCEIILCTLNFFKRVNYGSLPVNNGESTLQEFNDAILDVAEFFGLKVIRFDRSLIDFYNLYPKYIESYDSTTPTHPNELGQTVLARLADKTLK